MGGCKTPTPRRLTAYGTHSQRWAELQELLAFRDNKNHFLLTPAYLSVLRGPLGPKELGKEKFPERKVPEALEL